MAATPPEPFEDEVAAIDWAALRASASRLVRMRMRGFSAEDIEDAAGIVSDRYLQFVRRQGRPDSPEGLLADLCRKVAANAVRRRQRERERLAGPPPEWAGGTSPEDDEAEVLQAYQTIVFMVREYFALRRAQCTPIAEAKAAGEPLKTFAERTQQSYEKVRQDWSRCVKLIHQAMRRNRLRLPWPSPPNKRRRRDD